MSYMNFIGVVLRDLRHDRGLKQTDVARLSGVDIKTVSVYERGYRLDATKLIYINRIASALGTNGPAVLLTAWGYYTEREGVRGL